VARGGTGASNRGRIDKHAAILAAALRVFAESGFGYANIDAIAAAAGVAKPTVYNHFGDKETLFRAVMTDSADESAASIVKAINGTPRDDEDLVGELNAIAQAVVRCQVSDKGWALQRLLCAEAARMPDLYDDVVSRGGPPVLNALAGRLALIAYAGHLDLDDPVLAANQFMALLTGNLPALTALGTRPVAAEVLAAEVNAAVHTFLRAFGARTEQPSPRAAAKGAAAKGTAAKGTAAKGTAAKGAAATLPRRRANRVRT
jgi:AcrR family transcriptional regulator